MAQNTDIVMESLYYYRLFSTLHLLNREPARALALSACLSFTPPCRYTLSKRLQ